MIEKHVLRWLMVSLLVVTSQLIPVHASAVTALYNPETATVLLPRLEVKDVRDFDITFEDVVIRITDFGTILVDDPQVGAVNIYDREQRKLMLPAVDVGGVVYSRVSLTGVELSVRNVSGVFDDDFNGHDLDIVVVAGEGDHRREYRVAHLDNVPIPNSRGDFCTGEHFEEYTRSMDGMVGTWDIESCSFDGTVGKIEASLTAKIPIGLLSLEVKWPFSIRFVYAQRS